MKFDNVRSWLNDPWHFLLFVILLGSFFIRLQYFDINPTVWWDEAEYLSTSLHWALDVPYILNAQRPPLFAFMTAILFFFNATEFVVRLLLELIPSVLLVFVTYLLGRDLFDKRVGVVAALCMSVFWLALFNTARIHVDVLATLLQALVLWTFWRGYVLNEKKYLLWMGLWMGLAFLTKFTAGLVGVGLLLFVLITDKLQFLRNKHLWMAFGVFVLLLLPFLYFSYVTFGDAFALTAASHVISDPSANFGKDPIFWGGFTYISTFLLPVFFGLFIAGLVSLYSYLIAFDVFLKKKDKQFLASLFLLVVLGSIFGFFVFVQRTIEDRWLLPISVILFLFVGLGVKFLYEQFSKLHRGVAVVALVGLLLFGAVGHLSLADSSIMAKKDTYLQVKDAALWMGERTTASDTLVSGSGPQTTYYSRRRVLSYADYDTWYGTLLVHEPKYMTYSVFERHPDWMREFLEKNQGGAIVPVHGYFADAAQTQPVLIVYEFTSYDFVV